MKLIVALFLIIMAISTQKTMGQYIHNLSIDSKYKNCYVVSQIGHDKYLLLRNNELLKYYKHSLMYKYSYDSYQSFLTAVLSYHLKLDTAKLDFDDYLIFKPNGRIRTEYEKNGLQFIMDKYLQDNNGILKNKPNDQYIINNVLAIMIDNDFFVTFSDYSGFYYFKK